MPNDASDRTERAHALYSKTFANTTIKDESNEFPKFNYKELTLGKTLGEGGFGIVSEILAFQVITTSKEAVASESVEVDPSAATAAIASGNGSTAANHNDDDDATTPAPDATDDMMELQGRKFIADHCLRDGHDARYAVKLPKPELLSNENMLTKALADMVVESHLLSTIEHPNIVKLRATSLQPRYHVEYFIVMDRLYDTLEKRLETWAQAAGVQVAPKPVVAPVAPHKPPPPKKQQSRVRLLLGGCFCKDSEESVEVTTTPPAPIDPEPESPTLSPKVDTSEQAKAKMKFLEDRLVVAFDLASALSYLHGRNIIYRDMKPENCAFDVRGDCKMFDFGTAKELPHDNGQRDKNETFHLTGVTGSLPYMAPEVAKTDPYNHKCDVFSFAVMLWQIMALQMPFSEYESDLKRMWEEVHNGPHKRPTLPRGEWPKPIELCLKRGWAENPLERMEMSQIEGILKKEIVRVRKGDASGLRHDRRRSTFVFRR